MDKQQKKLEKLKGVIEVSRVINSSLDLQDVLSHALKIEQEVMDAEAGCLLLIDEECEYLNFVTALGEVCDQLQAARVKLGQGIGGWVAQHREPVLIPDAQQDPRFDSSFDKKTGFTTKSMICIPLINKDRLIGVAQVINRRDGESFDEDDLEMFILFGGQLAVAIDNAFLHTQLLNQQRMEQELETARMIQRSFLPDVFPELQDFSLSAVNIPARFVSGDFYDCFQLSDENICIVIGDVSGKGVPAALYMANLMNMLRYRLYKTEKIKEGLNLINNRLVETGRRGMFVTLAVLVLDPRTRELLVFRGGHLPPLLLRKDGRVEFLADGGGPPVGILKDAPLVHTQCVLEEGDTVLLYTDGITESKTHGGEELGLDGLATLVTEPRLPLKLLISRIMAEITRGSNEALHDDLTVVGLHWDTDNEPEKSGAYSFQITSDPRYLSFMRRIIDHLAKKFTIPADRSNKLKLALDEALTNIIRHGYESRPDGIIDIEVAGTPAELVFRLRDYGLQVEKETIRSRALDEIRPGGLGVHFICSVMDQVEYNTDLDQGTLLTLTKKLIS